MPSPAACPARLGSSSPSFAIHHAEFADADELSLALRHGSFEIQPTRGGRYRGSLIHLEADGVGLQWGFHAEPTLSRGAALGDHMFLARWGEGAPVWCNGREVQAGALLYAGGAELQTRAEGPIGYFSVSLPGLAGLAATLAPDTTLPSGAGLRHVVRAVAELRSLNRLLAEVRSSAEAGTLTLGAPAARQGFRETIGAALLRVLSAEGPERDGTGELSASALVRSTEAYLRERRYQPVFLSELCAAAGASEPRLRRAFAQVYGVGPVRYLRLRRLAMVRRDLRATRQDQLTVSAAAARYGFFELGRFAGDYRSVFGEPPSHTPRAR